MNREIKFRAWDYQNNRWATDNDVGGSIRLNFCLKDYFINIAGEKAFRFSFTQYTGLEDKNGKEIYEDDIVKCDYGFGKIVFNNGCFMVKWVDDKEADMELLSSKNGRSIRKYGDVFTIIGNIYENSELLETENVQMSERKVEK